MLVGMIMMMIHDVLASTTPGLIKPPCNTHSRGPLIEGYISFNTQARLAEQVESLHICTVYTLLKASDQLKLYRICSTHGCNPSPADADQIPRAAFLHKCSTFCTHPNVLLQPNFQPNTVHVR